MLISSLDFKEVFDNLSVCMFLVDVTPEGRFKFAGFNPAGEQAVGLSSATVSGKFVEEVFEPELAQKVTGSYRRCLEAGMPITYDDELNMPGGKRYFHSNLIPLRNAKRNIDRIIGACIDMTDFKRSQEQAFARQKLESLGLLASGIAHDFNNLVGGILALTELGALNVAEGRSGAEDLNSIKSVAVRAGELIRELMVYAGKEEGTLEPVDLSLLVEDMLGLLKMSIGKQATLVTDLPKNLPRVFGNSAQLRQVVMNLLMNASEALAEKPGSIRVSLALANPGQKAHDRLEASRYLRLTVEDSGSGMSASTLERIFDPFFTTKISGRGLGLAATQGIVRAHGGMINVTSNPGSGSSFEILFPSMQHLVPSTLEKSRTSATPSIAGTILVVEDETALRDAVVKMLLRQGLVVLEAGDGTAAINALRATASAVPLVLLDMTIPGKSGPELIAELRRDRPGIKIVLTSAFSEDVALLSITPEKVDGFIRKPYNISELIDTLHRAGLTKLEPFERTRKRDGGEHGDSRSYSAKK